MNFNPNNTGSSTLVIQEPLLVVDDGSVATKKQRTEDSATPMPPPKNVASKRGKKRAAPDGTVAPKKQPRAKKQAVASGAAVKQPRVKKVVKKTSPADKKSSAVGVPKRKRATKNSTGKLVSVTCPEDHGAVQLDDEEERRLSEEIYGTPDCSFDNATLFDAIRREEAISVMSTEAPDIRDGGLECRRCKSRKIYSRSMQIRGGDESTTVFATCSQCNYSWRE
jgi:DNA-directed RNA polymerase subunit M/transcription elongation factor TFIIS